MYLLLRGFCTGHLRSYGIKEVVERVKSDYAAGSKEFWITSQDTAAYGRDLGIDLAELLEALDKTSFGIFVSESV